MPLDEDIALFEKKREEWLAAGLAYKWFVIFEGKVVGHYDEPSMAYERAVEEAGGEAFLLRRLTPEGPQPESIPALHVGAIVPGR